jgi:hypothetical protein
MPHLRGNRAAATPASRSFGISTTCDSVNRDFVVGQPGLSSIQNRSMAMYA